MSLPCERRCYENPANAVTPAPDNWMTPADLLALLEPGAPATRRPWGSLLTPASATAPDLPSPPSIRTAGTEE